MDNEKNENDYQMLLMELVKQQENLLIEKKEIYNIFHLILLEYSDILSLIENSDEGDINSFIKGIYVEDEGDDNMRGSICPSFIEKQ